MTTIFNWILSFFSYQSEDKDDNDQYEFDFSYYPRNNE